MKKILVSLLAGCCLPLAFAPFQIYSVAFFAPAVLLHFWLKSTAKMAALIGALFGIGFFGVGISWIYISIHHFGNASIALATFLTACVVLLMCLHFALFGFTFRYFRHKSLVKQCLLIFPALWVCAEWVNNAVFGFPWLLLGYSQLPTPLHGFAPFIGVYGLSLICALIGGALVLLLHNNKTKKTSMISIVTIVGCILLGFILQNHAWTKPRGDFFKVSLIQGNIPQEIKWNPEYTLQNMAIYKDLTMQHLDSQLILWPEGALPVLIQNAVPFINKLTQIAQNHNTTIGFGATSFVDNHYYNALYFIGDNNAHYFKKHLVPFGEYTPFEKLFLPMEKYFHMELFDLSSGSHAQNPVKLNNDAVAPFICYEIIFPQEVLSQAVHSHLLITVSDDSWFGQSIALAQHVQMAQMRALETGRYLLLSTNTGITAVISPLSEIIASAPMNERHVVSAQIQMMEGKTPLMQWYYYPVLGLIVLMILLGAFA